VLGYLETTGLAFSDLWVLGLDDQSWPRPVTANPFLPTATCERHGVPRSTAAAETGFAARRLAHWQACAGRLTFSHAGPPDRASPLVVRLAGADTPAAAAGPHPFFVHRAGQLESLDDPLGMPLEPGHLSGGARRLADQAACPFRGYAIHRLRLEPRPGVRALPDAGDAGTVIHAALQHLYERVRDRGREPASVDDAEIDEAVSRALTAHYGGLPEPFVTREHVRLRGLLRAWSELERGRGDVTVEATELERDITLDGFELHLRIDRLDRVGDALVVLDYKTGETGTLETEGRLLEPQLPLYALADEAVRGVLHARIDARRPRLQGIAGVPVANATIRPPAGGSWSRQRRSWQRELEVLVREVGTGAAAVAPQSPRICERCHLGRICRIALADAPP
jgi:RecB family exonuclease